MSDVARPILGFIGAGKVGSALARLWHNAGYTISAISSRTPGKAAGLAAQVGALTGSPRAVVASADLILLTVPDEAIASVVSELAALSVQGKGFVHTSGARDSRVLAVLAHAGAQVGSFHPAFPFADVDIAVERLLGAAFAVEADVEPLRVWLLDLVAALAGLPLLVPPGRKALYHAALVLLSNYTVTLYALAESLLQSLGADRETADRALNALLAGTVDNLTTAGIPRALTGPMVRADVSTIEANLRALEVVDPRLADLYQDLGRLTLPLVAARGVDPVQFEAIFTRQPREGQE